MRKFIDELIEEAPVSVPEDEEYEAIWREERDVYGFDNRDIWDLDRTMTQLLYERLKLYEEETDFLDHESIFITVDGEERTAAYIMNRLLELGKDIIVAQENGHILSTKDEETVFEKQKEFWSLWGQSFYIFWS